MAKGQHYGAAAEFIRKQYGGDVVIQELNPTVTTTPSRLVAHDSECVFTMFINLGANPVYLVNEGAPSATRGLFLSSQGGLVSFNVRDDAILSCLQWIAVSTGGDSEIYILRVRRETKVLS